MIALGIHDLGLFMLTSLVLNLTPGADTLYVMSRSARGGWRHGVAGAFGIGLGCMGHAVAAALGVAAVLAASRWAFDGLKWAGALYLAWLGLQMLRAAWRGSGATAVAPDQAVAPLPTLRQSFTAGLLTNLLNPKVGLFFLAFVPQFVDVHAGRPLPAFLLLGLLFNLSGVSWLLLVALLTDRVRGRVAPSLRRALQGLGGGLFVLLAARLATARGPG
ncbi:LysE family translocator [Methylibium sp. Root1272]|uniref:LysE family translocator n=1 Tax=Methylibium sp. Root1272 TaxID=1736441 RepID=UPI000B1DD8FD|nr:LysE family translocator [Methylibium sp. Root1272]